MDTMTSEEHNNFHAEDCPPIEPPPAVDSERSPQLDKVICHCRRGCACASSRDSGDSDANSGGGVRTPGLVFRDGSTDTNSEDGHSEHGEEGVEDRQIDVGDMGMVSERETQGQLDRRRRLCICNMRMWLAEDEGHPFNGYLSMNASGFLSDISRDVGPGSIDRSISTASLTQSAMSGSSGRRSPGILTSFAGVQFEQRHVPTIPYYFLQGPIPLTPEQFGFQYSLELDFSDAASSDHSEYDIW